MAIGQSRLHELLKRRRLISNAVFWVTTFESQVTRNTIIDWIREDQLRGKGINADGQEIGFYSYATELITNGEKQEGDPYTLNDTGEFYRSMYMTVLTDAIQFNANPIKGNDNLFAKYGENILNLTDENLLKLKQLVKRKYIEQLRKILFGT